MIAELKLMSVLLAEDDEDDRLVLQNAFEESEFKVELTFVSDGALALAYLGLSGTATNTKRPDLVLLDLNMPKVNGFEVLHAIRQDSYLKSLPVIILTTSKAPEDICSSYNLGCNAYFIKPNRFSELQNFTDTLMRYWHKAQIPGRIF